MITDHRHKRYIQSTMPSSSLYSASIQNLQHSAYIHIGHGCLVESEHGRRTFQFFFFFFAPFSLDVILKLNTPQRSCTRIHIRTMEEIESYNHITNNRPRYIAMVWKVWFTPIRILSEILIIINMRFSVGGLRMRLASANAFIPFYFRWMKSCKIIALYKLIRKYIRWIHPYCE